MFKRDWGNGFATGLIIGICLFGLIYLSAGSSPQAIIDDANYVVECSGSGSACDQEKNNPNKWWWWSWRGDVVSSSDTLAQWIMAILTIFAVGLLYLTFRHTGDASIAASSAAAAASDSNLFLKQDQRPWLKNIIKARGPFFIEDGKATMLFDFGAKNVGKTPATHVHFEFKFYVGNLPFSRPEGEIDGRQVAINVLSRIWGPRFFRSEGVVIFPGDESTVKLERIWTPVERISDGDDIHLVFGSLYRMPGDMKDDGVIRHTVTVYRVCDDKLQHLMLAQTIS